MGESTEANPPTSWGPGSCWATTGGTPWILRFWPLVRWAPGRVSVGSKLGQASEKSGIHWIGYLQITHLSAGKWKVPIHAVPCRQDSLDGCSPVHFWWSCVVPQSHPKCLSSKALKNGWFFFTKHQLCNKWSAGPKMNSPSVHPVLLLGSRIALHKTEESLPATRIEKQGATPAKYGYVFLESSSRMRLVTCWLVSHPLQKHDYQLDRVGF